MNRYKNLEGDFKDLAACLKRIDPKAPDALSQIRDLYVTKFEDLRQRVYRAESKDDEGIPERIP